MTVRELLKVADEHTNVEIFDEDDHYVTSGYAVNILKCSKPIVKRMVARFEVCIIYDYPWLQIVLAEEEDV